MLQNHNQLGRIASADEFIFFCPAQQPLAVLVLFFYPRERNSGKGCLSSRSPRASQDYPKSHLRFHTGVPNRRCTAPRTTVEAAK
jgi:hypothetical protein